MKGDRVETIAVGVVIAVVLAILFFCGLFGWAFIELVQWITSK